MKSKSKLAAEFLNNLSTDGSGNIIQNVITAPLSSNDNTIASTAFVNTAVDAGTFVFFNSGVGTSGIAATTNYPLFPAAKDTLGLGIGTYKIKMQALVTVATSVVSATLLLNPKGAGTAVGTIMGITNSSITNSGTPNHFALGSTALGTAFTVTAASAVAGRAYVVSFEGILNITTSGTLIPSYQFSAALTSGVVTLNALNNIIIEKISSSSVTTNGGWY